MTNASGRFVITLNGEIYNYRELRAELSAYSFRTKSDTEVLLAAFEKWGMDAFGKLRGMYALGIWDTRDKKLMLARDHAGIKPLLWRRAGQRIMFSSELKGMLADKNLERRINREALASYARLRYVPEPLSMVESVAKIPAGHAVMFSDKDMTTHEHSSVPLFPLFSGSSREAAGRLLELIDESVRMELVSDRPVGLFLSGGLDSTVILDAASRGAGAVETFSLRFALSKQEEADKFNADADSAKRSAAHYGARHHEFTLSESDFSALLPEVVRRLHEPVGNATAVAQLKLAREARRDITVALAGDGGDELFGGYPRYRLSLLMDYYQRMPAALRAVLNQLHSSLRKLDTPEGVERIERFLFEKDDMLRSAFSPEYISETPAERFAESYLTGRGEADFTQLFMDADRRSWLTDEALARADSMTMASALEMRVPLLNLDVVRFASRLPTSMRVGLGGGKRLLRAAFSGRLPAHVLGSPKRGWFSPIAKWLRRPALLALTREALSKGFHAGTDAALNFNGLSDMLEGHVQKGRYAAPLLWSMVTLRLWAREHDLSL